MLLAEQQHLQPRGRQRQQNHSQKKTANIVFVVALVVDDDSDDEDDRQQRDYKDYDDDEDAHAIDDDSRQDTQ